MTASKAWEQYLGQMRDIGEDINRPMRWSFYLSDVAGGDIPRLTAELKRKGYEVVASATLTESFPSKICAEKVAQHTAGSIAAAWEEFEAIAGRYSCTFSSASYKPGSNDAI